MSEQITTPVARMIGGDLYTPRPVLDNKGIARLGKDGTPLTSFSIGIAIPKTGGDWSQTSWGAEIKRVGDVAFPGRSAHPTFAWKIIDGDSTIPNKKGRIPNQQEGYAGNWVMWLSQGWAPELWDATGSAKLTEPRAIIPGYFVQVLFTATGNKSDDSPGVYLNPLAVARAAYGAEIISTGVDVSSAGFGQGVALPAGASVQPVAQAFTPTPVAQPIAQPVVQPAHMPPPPNYAVLQPPARHMTAAANGATYEAYIAAGWTDQQLIQNGYMTV